MKNELILAKRTGRANPQAQARIDAILAEMGLSDMHARFASVAPRGLA